MSDPQARASQLRRFNPSAVMIRCTAIVLVALTWPRTAVAAPFTFDRLSFGTGTAFESSVDLTTGQNFNLSQTKTSQSGPWGALSADLSGALPQLDYNVTDLGHAPFAEVLVADGMSITGQTVAGTMIPATLTLDGTFSGPHVDTSFLISARSYLGTSVTVLDNLFFDATFDTFGRLIGFHLRGTGTAWPLGVKNSASVPVNFDPNQSDGFILFAEGTTVGGTTDFSGTIGLAFDPPPGVSVALASGQVFGGAPVPVPEPGTFTLLGTGLLALARRRRRPIA